MSQFKEKPSFDQHSFHTGDTAKNPVVFPVRWLPPEKPQHTILHIFGFIVVALAVLYTFGMGGVLLFKFFMEAVR